MNSVVVPSSLSFWLQTIVLLSYLPMTFIAYRLLREPLKRKRARWELDQFNLEVTEDYEVALSRVSYSLVQYILPLSYIILIFIALYAMTQPYAIRLGLWKGLLEENVNVFGTPSSGEAIPRDILVGRFMFWCWLGAYIHSVDQTIRHYLAHDLTPNVYVYTAKRFTVAFVAGALIGLVVGQTYRAVSPSFDANLITVYLVSFFVGMFPDTGIHWIKASASKALQQRDKKEEMKQLSEIEGISLWHQERLDQEDIVNAQNLASADLLALVVNTPFDVGQIVDWVDQAILLVYSSTEQLAALRKTGLRYASSVVTASTKARADLAQASGLSESELHILQLSLKSATNMGLILRYRVRASQLTSSAPEVKPATPAEEILAGSEPEKPLETPAPAPAPAG